MAGILQERATEAGRVPSPLSDIAGTSKEPPELA